MKGGILKSYTAGCLSMFVKSNLIDLGEFSAEADALAEAKKRYLSSKGCYYCCKEVDTDKLKKVAKK